MMRSRTAISLLCLLALTALAEVRLALIPLDEAGASQADLALAELSGDDDIVFLERSEIAKIKSEIRLMNLTDFVPDSQLMENTQLFILVMDSRLLAFDSRTGVRLLDCNCRELPELLAAVRTAVAKQRKFSVAGLKKISVMPMVPAHLEDKQEKLAREAEAALLQKMCVHPELALLERRYLRNLLDEPDAAENKLAAELFAGAVVMKPTAVPDGDKGVSLALQFYSPDGKKLLKECSITIRQAAEVDEACSDFLKSFEFPAGIEDKQGEASEFMREAWFAFHHNLDNEAMASAVNAAALDDGYAQELSRIAFLSTRLLLGKSTGKEDPSQVDRALDDMRLGVELAEKHNGFSREGRIAFWFLCSGASQGFFRQLTEEQHEVFMELVERAIAVRKSQLDREVLPLTRPAGDRWPYGVFAVESRALYVTELDRFCKLSFDFSLWDRFVYPEMAKLVEDFAEYAPEIERFIALDWQGKLNIVSRPEVKQARCRENRQIGGMSLFNVSFGYLFDNSTMTSQERDMRMRAFSLMAQCKYLPIAITGLEGQMRLRKTGKEMMDYFLKTMSADDKQAVSFYYGELKRIISNGIKMQLGSLCQFHAPMEGFVKERMEIEDLAVSRLASYDLFNNSLLYGYEKWDRKTAAKMYAKLGEWQTQTLAQIKESDEYGRRRARDYFRRFEENLETMYGFVGENTVVVKTVNPYARTYSPFEDDRHVTDVKYLGCAENTVLVLVKYDQDRLCLAGIGLDNPQGAWKQSEVELPEKDIHCIFGAILDDCYAAFLVKDRQAWISVFPKHGGKPEIYPVRNYRGYEYRAFTGGGDSLFVAYDGRDIGNVFEDTTLKVAQYNVRTRETSLIVSSLDRSVKWPLQGMIRNYEIGSLACDAPNRRVVMMMNEKPPEPGKTVFDRSLWAYYWDTGEWQAISNYLPFTITSFSFPQHISFLNG